MADALRPENGDELQVGDFSVTQQFDGSYWILHESGEGMQTSLAKMEALIRNFYNSEF